MQVLDRAGLEKASCECYAIVRKRFDAFSPRHPLPFTVTQKDEENCECLMSALGQKRTFAVQLAMSALCQKRTSILAKSGLLTFTHFLNRGTRQVAV